MKRSLTILVIMVIAIVVVAATLAFLLQPSGGPRCGSLWSCAVGYPLEEAGTYGVAAEQCAVNSTYFYCVGGLDWNGGPHSEIYYGTLSESGNITGWTQNPTSYPTDVSDESCVESGSYLYCVGGAHDPGGDDVSSSYYAQFNSGGGLGMWFYTTPYPIPVDAESCVASTSYIYCVGGNNETDGTEGTVAPSSSAWYAKLSQSGIGNWSNTTPYPLNSYLPSCFTADGGIYCLGGVDSSDNPLGNAYYAPLSSAGIGQWVPTTAYPLPSTGQACAFSNGFVYCVGGATSGGQSAAYTSALYFAPVSTSGIGAWKEGPDYTMSVGTTCTIASGRLYCVGGYDGTTEGEDNYVNYVSLSSVSG
jgi:hypothetical protein